MSLTQITLGIIASTLAGLATGLGALPALFFQKVSDKALNTMLGGAAEIMLAATSFSLIIPGIEYGNQILPGGQVSILQQRMQPTLSCRLFAGWF